MAVIGGMLGLATVMLGVTAAVAQAPPTPFDCPTDGILTQSGPRPDPSEVRLVDMASGTETPGPTLSTQVNGIGYNVNDDLVYGVDRFNGGLIRFGANGELEAVPTPAQLTTSSPIGDVDENGHYWTIVSGDWMQIDLTADPPAFVDSGTITGDGIETYRSLIDWSYVPGTNSLYTVARPTDNSEAVLFRFHRDTQQFEQIGEPHDLGAVNAFGATYADSNGFLYASNKGTGVIYRIEVQSGTPTEFANGQGASENDGARCFTAPIPVDFGDAPDSYTTLVESDGARHSLADFDGGANTTPLMLGSNVSVEPDGQPSADADTFEDAVAEPITMTVGETITYTFAATNTGDITLSGVEINDTEFSGAGDLSDLDCDQDQPATLAPGETLECTATYVVRQADADAGRLTNIATVTGMSPTVVRSPPATAPRRRSQRATGSRRQD